MLPSSVTHKLLLGRLEIVNCVAAFSFFFRIQVEVAIEFLS